MKTIDEQIFIKQKLDEAYDHLTEAIDVLEKLSDYDYETRKLERIRDYIYGERDGLARSIKTGIRLEEIEKKYHK